MRNTLHLKKIATFSSTCHYYSLSPRSDVHGGETEGGGGAAERGTAPTDALTLTLPLLTCKAPAQEMERKRREEWKRHEDAGAGFLQGKLLPLGPFLDFRRRLPAAQMTRSGKQKKSSGGLSSLRHFLWVSWNHGIVCDLTFHATMQLVGGAHRRETPSTVSPGLRCPCSHFLEEKTVTGLDDQGDQLVPSQIKPLMPRLPCLPR